MRVVIDTNVYLDVILDRTPFALDSGRVISAGELQFFDAYCCATTLTDIYYIVRKALGEKSARRSVSEILRTCHLAAVGRSTVAGSLASRVDDFEDGIICEAALQIEASFIVTRNIADFKQSPIPAVTPTDFLLLLKQEG